MKQHPTNSSSDEPLPFGLKDGVMYEPMQVDNGSKCGCICPSCKAPLEAVANKPDKKYKVVSHFRHAKDKDCANGRETAIHLAAKQLIERRRELYFPELLVEVCKSDAMRRKHIRSKCLVSAGVVNFCDIRVEKNLKNFRPDLIATAVDGTEFIIEIAVTHRVDDIKLNKIIDHGVAAIEFDVSNVSSLNFEALGKALFESSESTKWLFHPVVKVIESEFFNELAAVFEAAKAEADGWEEQEKIYAEAKRLEIALANKQKAEREENRCREVDSFKSMTLIEKMEYCLGLLNIEYDQLPSFLNYAVVGGGSFNIPQELWQIAVFTAFIENRSDEYEFELDTVFKWVGSRFSSNNEFQEYKYRKFGKEAIKNFLLNLKDFGILWHYYLDKNKRQLMFSVRKNSLKSILLEGKGTTTEYVWEPTSAFIESQTVKGAGYSFLRGKRDD